MVERFHRTLKAALMARKKDWLLSLPLALLGLRCVPNESGCSPFMAVTGKMPLCPSVILDHSPKTRQEHEDFLKKFVSSMKELDFRPLPSFHMPSTPSYVPRDLQSCPYVYVRVDRIRKALEAPYSGPYQVLQRFERTFELQLPSGRTDVVSIDRLKPAVTPPSLVPQASGPVPPVAPASSPATSTAPQSQTIPLTQPYQTNQPNQPNLPDGPIASRTRRRVRFSEVNMYHQIPPRGFF